MRRIQPGVAGILGLWTPSSAIISPYGLAIALAENAHQNGADYRLGYEVVGIAQKGTGQERCFEVFVKGEKKLSSRVVVNSAGLHADEVSRMLGIEAPRVWACRGEYYVLDKRLDGSLKTLIYPVPGPNDPGLGIHLTPTVDGNILIGPSAVYIPTESRDSYRTTAEIMRG